MNNPLILTLKIDEQSLRFFDALRVRYFPPERNFLTAHVTLFHHLPGKNLSKISDDIAAVCQKTKVFLLAFTVWRFLGRGSAMTIESAELLRLRAQMAKIWSDDLTRQDSQKFQPHITVQNKVEPDEAKILYENLSQKWQKKSGFAEGLSLWHYVAPHWELEEEFLFGE